MKKIFLLICIALVSIFSIQATTIVPVTSTSGNDVWYMIKCNPRNPANVMETWITATPDNNMTYAVYSGGDDQLWKVVENGAGVALVNKKTGFYIDADNRRTVSGTTVTVNRISLIQTAPTTALQLVPSSNYPTLKWPGWDGITPGVFILDLTNGTTTVDANNAITVGDANNAFALTIYSPSSGNLFVANQPGWLANTNQIVLFRTIEETALEIKAGLLDAITTVTTGYNNSSEGLNPGQFSPDDREALMGAIEAAQEVYDDATSTTEEILAATEELNGIFTQFKSQVILPEVSSDNNEVWYYIQGTRPANTYMTAPAAGAGTQVKDLPVIPDATQLWKLVENGDGFALQNKASQEYLQTDFPTGTNLNTQADMPLSALRFITSSETFNKAYRFWIENTTSSTPAFRLHAGGSGNGWGLMNWTGGANDNCTWLFLSEDEVFRAELLNAKTAARAVYDASIEGDEFGQFSAASRTAFNNVLVAEDAKNMAEMTQEELKASVETIKTAVDQFLCNREVSTLSSVVKKKWFRLVNNMSGTGYASNKAMSSNGRTVDQKFTYETKDLNSDAQLFRFELNGDGTKVLAIVNKANNTFVGTDGMMLATAPDAEFEITALDNISFWIKPNGLSPLHAAATGVEILNWNSGAGSASAWKFEYVSSEDITDFADAYLAKRIQMRAKVNAALESVGAEIGQYTAASVAALETVVAAEEAKDASTLTQDQMRDGILAMNSASTAGFVVNTDIKLLKASSAGLHKWFRLINNMSGTGYASGKAMSSNGRLEGEPFTWEDKDITSDAQLFRFELTADETKVANIVNKENGMFVAVDGIIAAASTVGNDFEITQLAGGRSFWIDPTMVDVTTDPENPAPYAPLHAAASGVHIVNWVAGAGSASAWLFEFVKEEATSLKDVLSVEYKVRTVNNIITVDGVENFEVYSATGQKLNHKAPLMNGVYVVRVNNFIQKVVLK